MNSIIVINVAQNKKEATKKKNKEEGKKEVGK